MTKKKSPERPPTLFGANLRRCREAAGLTQRQLSERTGVHANTLAKLERGEQEPAWPIVLELAKHLGVDCAAFTEPVQVRSQPPGRPAKAKADDNSPEVPIVRGKRKAEKGKGKK